MRSFIFKRYFDALRSIQDLIFINYISTLNLIIIIGVISFILQRCIKLKQGRHRTPNEMVPPANQTAANAVHIHNSMQFGTQPRGANDYKVYTTQPEKYTDNMKIQTWFGMLELFLKSNVPSNQWVEYTIL